MTRAAASARDLADNSMNVSTAKNALRVTPAAAMTPGKRPSMRAASMSEARILNVQACPIIAMVFVDSGIQSAAFEDPLV